ncbi:hypothetical protein LTR09_008217 [Extremus antarcticus]|uniref:chitinase n=1 Tax=Extremus antarcticus TaxID=702011 RepID=A0AAJ0GAD0_9PEZI|nr:hypothetical protein LTR09_008217 [Extremus antarcticus]
MPPVPSDELLPISEGPRVVIYHQTHHKPDSEEPVSLLPLITKPTGVTHVIIAAVHLNTQPGDLTLNDNPPSHPKFATLWSEVSWLRAAGIKILAMLGGAAKGTFARLDSESKDDFMAYYSLLRDFLRTYSLDGIDLDVEEEMSLPGIIRLIDTLRSDFGPDFLITMAPVATALLPAQPHLSGFSYFDLERQRGQEIAWYNTQFYCGWGDASTPFWYDAIIASGWASGRVVMGLLTSPKLGAGYVGWEKLEGVLRGLRWRYGTAFGGIMGWEYFCAEPGGEARPWEWVEKVGGVVRRKVALEAPAEAGGQGQQTQQVPLRPFGAALPAPAHAYPAESVKTLQELGFDQQQAVAALNVTDGNVEQAAGLLFAD